MARFFLRLPGGLLLVGVILVATLGFILPASIPHWGATLQEVLQSRPGGGRKLLCEQDVGKSQG